MSPRYDLEKRTFEFAKNVRVFVRKLKLDISNVEDAKQLIRASGSVGANYIEANESLSKKDFRHRLKICRKEAKESRYWLRLINVFEQKTLEDGQEHLINESEEFVKIFSSILNKTERT